jgi:hypothetical protein
MVAEKRTLKPHFGAHGDEEIPVLIPNTAVKLVSGDYTATSGKLARCRIIENALRIGGLFLYFEMLSVVLTSFIFVHVDVET